MASSSNSASSEARELELLEKVELRIGLASSEAKLESILKTYLAPLLLKLASQHKSVRDKVISVCQHINVRIKPPSIKLPVAALLQQFKEHSSVPLIRHFDLLYVKQGLGRLSNSEQSALLPVLVKGIASSPGTSDAQRAEVFHMILRVLSHYSLPPRGSKEDDQLQSELGLQDDDAKYISDWLGKLFMLVVTKAETTLSQNGRPGLSASEYSFLTLHDKAAEAWDPRTESGLNLTETKITAAKFLASGAFTENQRFVSALIASADSNSKINEIGDDMLKRALPAVDIESRLLIQSIFALYLGGQQASDANEARASLQIKLLPVLSKSRIATTFTSEISQLVEQGLISEDPSAASERQRPVGRELARLRGAIFGFVFFFSRNSTPEDLQRVGPGLIARLRDLVEVQGWPVPDEQEDSSQRGSIYENIGQLASKLPPDTNLLAWLLRSLGEDPSGKDTSVSIEEALGNLLRSFTEQSTPAIQEEVRNLLLKSMDYERSLSNGQKWQNNGARQGKLRSTRYVAVRFANRCLPFNDCVARWIDVLAVGGIYGETREVAEEGNRGLDPNWYRMNTSHLEQPNSDDVKSSLQLQFPKFADLVHYMFLTVTDMDDAMQHSTAEECVSEFRRLFPTSFSPAITFLRQILLNEALSADGQVVDVDADWARKVEVRSTQDIKGRQDLKSFLERNSNDGDPRMSLCLEILFTACFDALVTPDATYTAAAGEYFVHFCGSFPSPLLSTSKISRRFRELLPVLQNNDANVRAVGAHAFGLLASNEYRSAADMLSFVLDLLEQTDTWSTAIGAKVNQISGVIAAVGYFTSRVKLRGLNVSKLDVAEHNLLKLIFKIWQSSSRSSYLQALLQAITQLSLSFNLSPNVVDRFMPHSQFVDELKKEALSGQQSAILALGCVCMNVNETQDGEISKDMTHCENAIFDLSEIREVEAQFSVGEAITYLACSWQSTALAIQLDVDSPIPTGPKRETTLARVLTRVLKGCKQTKPSVKRASVIWLLCLVQFCGRQPEIQAKLTTCQAAFKHCLSDREDIVQEAASRGLGLVYEQGDRQMKDDLVRDLVSSFSDNKAQLAGNVTEDTELFEPGALPTGDGSVTTYKDILSLSSEVGDSSLVYRFMSLAANNNIWKSRAAFGRFGLTNVFADSSVEGYLSENPKLYPKLYRYRFDPNPNVQRSMNDIWNALVKDSSTTIKTQFDAIMNDLLGNILSREWRVRQACCAAIADLVQGREFHQYEKHLGEIWSMAFKVMDDIKDSVRVTAASLARTLTNILTRSLESGDSLAKSTSAMLEHVLPFLLSTSGLESSAQDVQMFSIRTLLKIIKKSNVKALRSFTPELVERLTGMLSILEPQEVNYLHLNASKYNLTEQKIDDMRLSSIRASPLMEAIERCLELLDDQTMTELVPRLESVMRTSVGLPSKVGCSRILVFLATHRTFVFRSHSDYFLKLIERYIIDRNETVSASYAVSAGYISRSASDEQIMALMEYCKRLYFKSEDDRHRVIAGDVIRALSKHASDKFKALSGDILPFVFLAKHDSNEQVREQFQDTWNDNVGGGRAVMLYLTEICELAMLHLDSPKWFLKHTSARVVAQTIIAASASGVYMSSAQAEVLWPPLVKAIGGKTWDGKQVLLIALVKFVENGGDYWRNHLAVADEITKIIIREAKRQNQTYKPFAIHAIGQVASARKDIDMSKEVLEIAKSSVAEIQAEEDEDKMDVDGDEREGATKKSQEKDSILENVVEASFACLGLKAAQSPEFPTRLTTALELAIAANKQGSGSIFGKSVDGFRAMIATVGKDLADIPADSLEACRKGIVGVLFDAKAQGYRESVRLQRAQAVSALMASRWGVTFSEVILESIEGDMAEEKSTVVRQELEKAKRGGQ